MGPRFPVAKPSICSGSSVNCCGEILASSPYPMGMECVCGDTLENLHHLGSRLQDACGDMLEISITQDGTYSEPHDIISYRFTKENSS